MATTRFFMDHTPLDRWVGHPLRLALGDVDDNVPVVASPALMLPVEFDSPHSRAGQAERPLHENRVPGRRVAPIGCRSRRTRAAGTGPRPRPSRAGCPGPSADSRIRPARRRTSSTRSLPSPRPRCSGVTYSRFISQVPSPRSLKATHPCGDVAIHRQQEAARGRGVARPAARRPRHRSPGRQRSRRPGGRTRRRRPGTGSRAWPSSSDLLRLPSSSDRRVSPLSSPVVPGGPEPGDPVDARPVLLGPCTFPCPLAPSVSRRSRSTGTASPLYS